MKDSNHIIQGLWVMGELSPLEQLSIKSFLANGHEYHLYVYEDVKGIPAETVVKDGNEVLSKERIFTPQKGWAKGSFAPFADLFRYNLLNTRGGWWADTDVVCLKPFDFEDESIIGSSFEGEHGDTPWNGVLKLPPASPVCTHLIKECEKKSLDEISFSELGPYLLWQTLKSLELLDSVLPHEVFCPIDWRLLNDMVYHESPYTPLNVARRIKRFLSETSKPKGKAGKISSASYAVHFWSALWKRTQLDKHAQFHPSCLFEKLKKQYA